MELINKCKQEYNSNMDIYNIKDINDIINTTYNNKHIETIENK